MRKIFSLLAAVLFAGSMMASEAIMQYTGGVTANMVGDGANNAATVGLDADLFTVLADKGSNQNLPGLNKANDIRLYADKNSGNGNIITVSIANGTITSIVLDIKQTATFVVKAGETAVTEENGAYAINATSFSIQNTTTGATTQLQLNKITITYTAEGGGEPVEPTPTELQAVSDSTTWDFSKITANTANALYGNDGIKLTDESTPSKNDEVIYADYSADFMTFAEDFNKAAIAFKGEYPIRKNKYCQAGTLHFKADVAGTIEVKFSDTGSSASATAVKRYLVVNGEQTEYWTSRENNGETPYDAQLNMVSGKIAVPAGDVTITGSSAIVVYYVTFVPASDEPVVLAAPYCQTEVGHLFLENPDPNSFVLLSIGAASGKTIVRIDQDAAKNTQMFDYLQVTGLASEGADVAEGGAAAMAVEFDTPTAVNDSITLEILWSTVNWEGRWMIQNVKVPAAAACASAVLVEVPVELPDPTNCAEAAEAALSVAANNELYKDGAVYTIQGYVTSIAYAYDQSKGNMSFWMADAADGGNVLEAYKCTITGPDNAPAVGDKVAVTGSLTKYNTTPEFAAGCTVEILEHATPVVPQNLGAKTIAEFLDLKNTKDTCILTGVVSNIVNNVYGNFDLIDETDTVYVYGLLTPAGESQKFADLNVAENDTLTVLAIYNEYKGTPQAKNAIFVEVKKAPKAPAQDIEITLSSLTTPGALIWTDAVAEAGWWQIMGANEAFDFSISNVNTTETAGVYTIDDLDADYSYINIYGENDTTKVAFVDGSVTVAVSAEGIVTVNGTLVGSDGNNYIFNLTYKDPVAENTVNVAVPEWQLVDDYVAYLGLFAVAGEDANGTYVQLALNMPNNATEIAGDYTEEDFDLQYFGCYVADANGAYRIFSATIKVVQNEAGEVFVTADILCYNNTLYKVTTPAGQGLSNTAVETKATKTIKNGQLIIEKNGVQYNAQGAVIR